MDSAQLAARFAGSGGPVFNGVSFVEHDAEPAQL
jgi:hypothetical protein